jgi:hypothetical protein
LTYDKSLKDTKRIKKSIGCSIRSYICGAMKKILICLTIAWALCFLNSFHAHDIEPQYGFNITQQDDTSTCYLVGSENIIWDVYLEDISDDDSDDSERKKVSSGTTSHINTSFVRQFFYDDTFKKILSPKFFFSSRASLLVFLCVFRI